MTVRVSVPGKIHLMGEHAIVYGKPALLAAINLRLTASVTVGSTESGRVDAQETLDPEYIKTVVSLVKTHFDLKSAPDLTVAIDGGIPAGYHLGSSAASAACVIGATMYALRRVWNPTLINTLAYEAEKIKHGNPSGGDNSAIVFGGFIWYRKELEFLRTVWQLPLKHSPVMESFFLIDTGRPQESTGEMVAMVSSKFKVQSSKFAKIFDRNEQATRRVAAALKNNNSGELINGIREGERTLEEMGVVSPLAKKIIGQIEEVGGAAKILGGGGRKKGVGFILGFCPNEKGIFSKLKASGLTIRSISLGEEGARLEEKGN